MRINHIHIHAISISMQIRRGQWSRPVLMGVLDAIGTAMASNADVKGGRLPSSLLALIPHLLTRIEDAVIDEGQLNPRAVQLVLLRRVFGPAAAVEAVRRGNALALSAAVRDIRLRSSPEVMHVTEWLATVIRETKTPADWPVLFHHLLAVAGRDNKSRTIAFSAVMECLTRGSAAARPLTVHLAYLLGQNRQLARAFIQHVRGYGKHLPNQGYLLKRTPPLVLVLLLSLSRMPQLGEHLARTLLPAVVAALDTGVKLERLQGATWMRDWGFSPIAYLRDVAAAIPSDAEDALQGALQLALAPSLRNSHPQAVRELLLSLFRAHPFVRRETLRRLLSASAGCVRIARLAIALDPETLADLLRTDGETIIAGLCALLLPDPDQGEGEGGLTDTFVVLLRGLLREHELLVHRHLAAQRPVTGAHLHVLNGLQSGLLKGALLAADCEQLVTLFSRTVLHGVAAMQLLEHFQLVGGDEVDWNVAVELATDENGDCCFPLGALLSNVLVLRGLRSEASLSQLEMERAMAALGPALFQLCELLLVPGALELARGGLFAPAIEYLVLFSPLAGGREQLSMLSQLIVRAGDARVDLNPHVAAVLLDMVIGDATVFVAAPATAAFALERLDGDGRDIFDRGLQQLLNTCPLTGGESEAVRMLWTQFARTAARIKAPLSRAMVAFAGALARASVETPALQRVLFPALEAAVACRVSGELSGSSDLVDQLAVITDSSQGGQVCRVLLHEGALRTGGPMEIARAIIMHFGVVEEGAGVGVGVGVGSNAGSEGRLVRSKLRCLGGNETTAKAAVNGLINFITARLDEMRWVLQLEEEGIEVDAFVRQMFLPIAELLLVLTRGSIGGGHGERLQYVLTRFYQSGTQLLSLLTERTATGPACAELFVLAIGKLTRQIYTLLPVQQQLDVTAAKQRAILNKDKNGSKGADTDTGIGIGTGTGQNAKAPRKDGSLETIRRQARLISTLVFTLERFEAAYLKTRERLKQAASGWPSELPRAIARDFKIRTESLDSAAVGQ